MVKDLFYAMLWVFLDVCYDYNNNEEPEWPKRYSCLFSGLICIATTASLASISSITCRLDPGGRPYPLGQANRVTLDLWLGVTS